MMIARLAASLTIAAVTLALLPAAAAAACSPSTGSSTVQVEREAADRPLDGSLIVSPPLIVLPEPESGDGSRAAVRAGERYVCEVTVRNRRSTTTVLRLVAVGIIGGPGAVGWRTVEASDPDARATLAPWLELPQTQLTLRPRDVARIPVSVSVPQRPPSGSVAGAVEVIVPTTTTGSQDAAQLGVEQRIQVGMLARTSTDASATLEWKDVDAPRLIWDRAPWKLSATLHNTGTSFTSPRDQLIVRTLWGSVAADVTHDQRPLLPGGSRSVPHAWSGTPWLGIYRWELRASGAGASSDSVSGWFVALPAWWIIALVVLVIITAVRIAARRRSLLEDHDEDEQLEDPV